MSTGTAADATQYDLVEALQRHRWLRLPLAVMQDVGPAVQTLGGLLALTSRETFASAADIGQSAWLPVPTARKHLVTLGAHGWLVNAGREHTRRGAPRRTCTYRVTARTRDAITAYAPLPWWACTKPTRGTRLTWASRAVLSIIMARLMDCIAAIDRAEGGALATGDVWSALAELNGDDRRWLWSLDSLCHQTGLARHSVIGAKHDLASRGIIVWNAGTRADGGSGKDSLEPREDFRVRVRPTGREGYCYVDWLSAK